MSNKKIAYVEQKEIEDYNYQIRKYTKRRIWWSCNCREVAEGLQAMGWEVRGFLKEELSTLPITKKTMVRGSIRTTRTAFQILGVPQPKNVDIPDCLMEFTHRKIWKTTLGQIRKAGKMVHIKPLEYQKAFHGHIFKQDQFGFYLGKESEMTSIFPNDFKVLASECMEFGDEVRAFILNGKLVYLGNYELEKKGRRKEVCNCNYATI